MHLIRGGNGRLELYDLREPATQARNLADSASTGAEFDSLVTALRAADQPLDAAGHLAPSGPRR
jgi:hypothetical protein